MDQSVRGPFTPVRDGLDEDIDNNVEEYEIMSGDSVYVYVTVNQRQHLRPPQVGHTFLLNGLF